jgi:hypothetical protein
MKAAPSMARVAIPEAQPQDGAPFLGPGQGSSAAVESHWLEPRSDFVANKATASWVGLVFEGGTGLVL